MGCYKTDKYKRSIHENDPAATAETALDAFKNKALRHRGHRGVVGRSVEKQISKLKANGRLQRHGSDKQGIFVLAECSS